MRVQGLHYDLGGRGN